MPGLDDMLARAQAAQGMMGPEAPMAPEAAPAPEMEMPVDEQPDIESGLSIIEAFAESLDPKAGEEVRECVNKIREIASSAAPMEEVPMEEAPMEAPPEGEMPPL